MAKKRKKAQGHYCKVCDQRKANEKFSGKGHAAHICKACAALPPSERAAAMTVNKLHNMAFRHLSESEIKWLRGKMNDADEIIRDTAKEVHRLKFPHYERNIAKKGLTARTMEFYINGEVWDEWGDNYPVRVRFFMEDTGTLRKIDYAAVDESRDTEMQLDRRDAAKFLKAVIHEWNALFWQEDFSDGDWEDDASLDLMPDDDDFEEWEAEDEPELKTPPVPDDREPVCLLRLKLNRGEDREIVFYNQLHNEPQDLFFALMDWFAPEDEEWEPEE